MKKLFFAIGCFCVTGLSAQNNNVAGCGGVQAVPGNCTLNFGYNNIADTVYLPNTGGLVIRANFDGNCILIVNPLIVDWYCNGTLVATGTPTFNAGVNGGYSLLTINTPGTYTTAFGGYGPGGHKLVVLAASATGIEENFSKSFKLFPNPVKNYFTIDFKNEIENLSVSLFNSIGEKVFSEKVSGNSATINVSDLSDGVYFVKLQNSQGMSYLKKIIVSK